MHIVALHAHPVDRRVWGPLAERARDGRLGAGVSLFSPDLRGRGTSRHASADVHTMELLAEDVASDIEELLPAGEPFVLAGLSIGGYVAFELLRRHRRRFRERLVGLVLCDTRASADDEAGRTKREEAIAAIRAEGMQAPLRTMLPKLLAPSSRGSAAEDLTRTMILATPPATAIADQLGMIRRADGFGVIASLDIPILFLVGEEDTVTPASDAEAMAELATNAPYVRLFTVPSAAHLSPLERPDDVAEAFAALVSRC